MDAIVTVNDILRLQNAFGQLEPISNVTGIISSLDRMT